MAQRQVAFGSGGVKAWVTGETRPEVGSHGCRTAYGGNPWATVHERCSTSVSDQRDHAGRREILGRAAQRQ